jgi:hypothetical protein
VRELRPKSWTELQDMLFGNSWNKNIQRFRSDYVYRGLGNADWALKTSLARLGGNFRELEAHLLRNFKKYATQQSFSSRSEWTWLAMAQHYGLPTRMLDWTYSPYVALHFATVNLEDYHRNGLIFCANYVQIHELLPARLKHILRRERSNAFTAEMLDAVASSLTALERLSRHDFTLFLEPPSLDQRIVNQFALFSFMSNPQTQFDTWLRKQANDLAFRIVIPAGMKWEIRDKLDQANISERVLFPGLDGLCQWLRRHYTPRSV